MSRPNKSNKPNKPVSLPAERAIIENKVYEIAEVIVSANYFVVDVELVVEHNELILRVFLDHPNEAVRVTVEDCRDISEALNPMLDEGIEELAEYPYALEVSSPGMFRKLDKQREFNFYANRRIEVQVGKEKPYFATLLGFNDTDNVIDIRKSDGDVLSTLPWPLGEGADKIKISLSPDLTQDIETKTVIRRISSYD